MAVNCSIGIPMAKEATMGITEEILLNLSNSIDRNEALIDGIDAILHRSNCGEAVPIRTLNNDDFTISDKLSTLKTRVDESNKLLLEIQESLNDQLGSLKLY